jgi:hypothetical protein
MSGGVWYYCDMRWELLAITGSALLAGILFTSDAPAVDNSSATTQPVISVAVNGAGVAHVRRGWPVIVEGTTANVNAGDLELVVVDAGGNPVDWTWQHIPDAKADDQGFTSVHWVMSGELSAKLGDGAYGVELRVAHGGNVVESAPAEVTVGAAPEGEEAIDEQMMLQVQYASLRGKDDQARQLVSQWLGKKPQSVQANTAQGDLEFMAGHLSDAKAAYQKALDLAAKEGGDKTGEPPGELMQRQNAVLRAMARNFMDQNPAATRPAGKP